MTLSLSATDLVRVEDTMRELLTPISEEPAGTWRARIARSVGALLGADQAVVCLEIDGSGSLYHGEGPWLDAALRDYEAYYQRLDVGLWERRSALGLEVFHRDDLYDRPEFFRTELYNDWGIPNRILDVLAMGFEVEGVLPFASVHLLHNTDAGPGFGERGRNLLRLLLPAFKAGVHSHRRYAACRMEILSLLDRLPQGVRMLNVHGQVLHESPRLVQLLAEQPERTQLDHALVAAGHVAIRLLHRASGVTPRQVDALCREVRLGGSRYRLGATILNEALLGRPAVLLWLEHAAAWPLSDAILRLYYGLTPREAEVSRLIAAGHSTDALATALGISRHTVRRHIENIFRKLGVHGRAAIGAKLRAE
jgi:DNA-binding CsgD family transcriptional regulator